MKKFIKAQVTSAVPLTKTEQGEIKKWVRENIDSAVRLQKRVDPNVIAGVKVHAGDWLFDGTFRGELERFKQALIEE